jgi:hypothetical protein
MFKILVPLALLGAFAFWKTKDKISQLKTQVTRLVYKSVNINDIRFLIDLLVTNPGKHAVSINEIDLELIYKGNTVTTITKRGLQLQVNAEKAAKITDIKIDVNLLSAINNILSALMGDYDKTMTVKGKIICDGIAYPIDEKIELTKA